MHNITYDEIVKYEDFGDNIRVKLVMIEGWIYVETRLERLAVNKAELRFDGTPRNIMDFLINKHPNETVTILDLVSANLSTSRDLRQVAIKAGIKGYLREIFMPVCEKYRVKVVSGVTLRAAETQTLLEALKHAQN